MSLSFRGQSSTMIPIRRKGLQRDQVDATSLVDINWRYWVAVSGDRITMILLVLTRC